MVSPLVPPSPFVVGDIVSLRRWIREGKGSRQGLLPAGKVVKIWRSNSASKISVKVRLGIFKTITLDSGWLTAV